MLAVDPRQSCHLFWSDALPGISLVAKVGIDMLPGAPRREACGQRPRYSTARTDSALLTSNPPGGSTARWVTVPSCATSA